MEPTLQAGSRVLALRRWPRCCVRPRQIVLLRGVHGIGPNGLVVKRVANGPGEIVRMHTHRMSNRPDQYMRLVPSELPDRSIRLARREIWVLGDNVASTDSRDWGPIAIDAVAGLVLPWSAIPKGR